MEIHYTKHHQAYVTNLNTALDKHPTFHEKSVEELVADLDMIPEDIRTSVRNNGGGHLNHSLFWQLMTVPDASRRPQEKLHDELIKTFGSFEHLQDAFAAAALTRFGSGWAWLVLDGKSLAIVSTANQDNPITEGKTPILGLDVWEHAYYLNYQNRRADYIKAWWSVVNWEEVAKRYQESIGA